MILTESKIKDLLKSKELVIEGLDEKAIGPASIDICLGNQFRRFRHRPTVIDPTEEPDWDTISTMEETEEIVLAPGEFALGITKEKIELPENVAGFLIGRSRFARLGIIVNSTADFIQPGVKNKQVLEIRNNGAMPLKLKAGMGICQLILMECKGSAKYKGIYAIQHFLK